jgi:prepilin-type N-terminal cleavage/methylation domain-containing protein
MRGFSLIELLLVIAIMAIVSSFAFAGYSGFQARQEVQQAAETLASNMRFAQSQAFAGVKPPSACAADDTLKGWYIQPNSSGYSIGFLCKKEGPNVIPLTDSSVSFSNNISIEPEEGFIIFQAANKGVVFAPNDSIGSLGNPEVFQEKSFEIKGNGATKTVVVTGKGEIHVE